MTTNVTRYLKTGALFLFLFVGKTQAQFINTVAGSVVTQRGNALNFGISTGDVAVDASGNQYIADPTFQVIRKVSTSGVISTVAGNGTGGYSGDNGPATSAELYNPAGVAVDGSGNIYIADKFNNRIRKVSTSGTISTVAGNGTPGYSGDGAAATSAQLNSPNRVAVDGSGNIYIVDLQNSVIRKVSTGGVISTVAGNGTGGYSGDGAAAASAKLNGPSGVVVDGSGNIYIADGGNNVIRKVSTSGDISTVAGNGTLGYSGDGGAATSAQFITIDVAVDGSGNIYIVDNNNNVIRKVSTSGVISTVAGNGTGGYSGDGAAATSAKLQYPTGVAVDGSGNIYIADFNNNRIRKVSTSGVISTVAGNGTAGYSGDGGAATSAQLFQPFGVAVDGSGNIYIAEQGNNVIRKVSTSGIISTVAGNGTAGYSGDGAAATSAQLNIPHGVAVDGSGNIYIVDLNNQVIRKVNTSGTISTVAGNGSPGYSGDGGAATSAQLNVPFGVAVDGSGNIYIADKNNFVLRKVNTSGVISTVAGNGNYGFSGDGGAATSAELTNPNAVAVDGSGNIYIADNIRIRKVSNIVTFTYEFTSTNPAFRDLGACITGVNTSALSNQVYTYNGSTWNAYSGVMTPGTGYRTEINGATTSRITVTGTATVTDDVTPTLNSGANTFSFVANPYNAVLDFDQLTTSNLQTGFYYLDPTYVDNLGYLGYKYYGTLTGAANTFSNGLSLTQYIQPGQGFFVKNTSSGTPSLTFKTSAEVSGNTANVFGAAAPLNRIATGLFIGGKNVDGAVAVFNSSFSSGLDNNDAIKIVNHAENLTFTIAGQYYCTNAFSLPKATDELPLHMNNLVANTTYTLKLDASQFVGNGLNAYIKDNVAGTQTLLAGDSNIVVFNTATDTASYSNRFTIVFGTGILPIKNITLSAKALNSKQVSIVWSVAGEGNVNSYQIERSVDGVHFSELATVSPSTSSNYSYIDVTPLGAEAYYRIKATDNIGLVSYSNAVSITNFESGITVFPNPLTSDNFKLSLGNTGKYTVSLVDALGKTVFTTNINHVTGYSFENIALGNKLIVGNYTIKATDENGKISSTQIIIK